MSLSHNPLVFDCRYYDLDAYHRHQMEKEMKKGLKKVVSKERTVFNDEEQRRYVLPLQARLYKYIRCCSLGKMEISFINCGLNVFYD